MIHISQLECLSSNSFAGPSFAAARAAEAGKQPDWSEFSVNLCAPCAFVFCMLMASLSRATGHEPPSTLITKSKIEARP
jgi:hypothetical protein